MSLSMQGRKTYYMVCPSDWHRQCTSACLSEQFEGCSHRGTSPTQWTFFAPARRENNFCRALGEFDDDFHRFRRPGLVHFPGKGSEAAEPKRVSCYGIASVFTPIQNRGKGYGKHMMRLLHWVLAPSSALAVEDFPKEWGAPPPRVEGAGDAMFSMLWSDVGKNFYSTCGPVGNTGGWTVSEATSTSFDLSRVDLESNATKHDSWLWLNETALLKAWEKDAERTQVEVKSRALTGDRKISFSILPTEGVAAYQHRRDMFLVKRALPDAVHWGIIKTNDMEGVTPVSPEVGNITFDETTIFASWIIEVRPPGPRTLLITRLRANAEAFKDIIGTLTTLARNNGVEKIEVWNLPHDLRIRAEALGGHSYERDIRLPVFKWYGPEAASDLVWVSNERFCWC
ncbi:hypothetical protein BD779DRAFT_603980 [Infundibulicybe gibba]|nr:hypothetical protein BD779DRAFT_603980 [Infundibulicybe gibba]